MKVYVIPVKDKSAGSEKLFNGSATLSLLRQIYEECTALTADEKLNAMQDGYRQGMAIRKELK